jgi:cephalosporin-C deacetylase
MISTPLTLIVAAAVCLAGLPCSASASDNPAATAANAPTAAEIDAFWRTTIARLAREPMAPEVTPLDQPVPYASYRVTLGSLGGVRIHARLALPIQGEAPHKPWPVVITAPGYGGEQQGVMLAECQRGYAILQVYPRGQGESAEPGKAKPDKLTGKLDGPDGAYYQGAYADVIRAIDFAVSRKDIDPDRVALVGTSQGGGIALAAASLDPRVKAVVAHVSFLCDVRQSARVPSLVKTLLDRAHRNDEAALRTLDYFDPLQLVSRLRAPVLISAGGKDQTCPAPTIRSVYDRIPGNARTLKVYPKLTHTSCVDFHNLSWAWLDQTLRKPAP